MRSLCENGNAVRSLRENGNKFLNFDVCAGIMMFRWINKQPGVQSFDIYAVTIKISMTEYQPFNKQSGVWFILLQKTEVYGGK